MYVRESKAVELVALPRNCISGQERVNMWDMSKNQVLVCRSQLLRLSYSRVGTSASVILVGTVQDSTVQSSPWCNPHPAGATPSSQGRLVKDLISMTWKARILLPFPPLCSPPLASRNAETDIRWNGTALGQRVYRMTKWRICWSRRSARTPLRWRACLSFHQAFGKPRSRF